MVVLLAFLDVFNQRKLISWNSASAIIPALQWQFIITFLVVSACSLFYVTDTVNHGKQP